MDENTFILKDVVSFALALCAESSDKTEFLLK